MDARWVTLSAVVGAIVLAGCGGTSHSASTPATTATASSGASATLATRLLTAEEIRGFAPQGQPASASSPASWVIIDQVPAAEQAKEAASLQRIGFLSGIRQNLATTSVAEAAGNQAGLSIVERFRSPSGARAQLAAVLAEQKASSKPGEFIAFPVKPLPGARGFALSSPQTTGINVAFTDGPYYYLVGAAWPTAPQESAARAVLVAEAAEHQYARVKSLPASS